MKDYVIFADSTCDLSKEIREQNKIEYLRMNILNKDKEYVASLDWDLYSPKELYDWMRNGTRVLTNQVPAIEFMTRFENALKANCDILYISCSSALSGSINTSYIIRDDLLKKYPNSKIICIDSLNSCFGQGIMALTASYMRNQGKSIDEVAEYIESNKLKVNQFATVESLEYLKRAGRVKASTAFFGNIFGVKPIIISDKLGQNYAYKKVKGRRNSLLELVQSIKDNIVDSENQYIFLGHADSKLDCDFVKEHIQREIKCKGIVENYIGPIIGASTGPGTIAVYFYGKEVTIIGD